MYEKKNTLSNTSSNHIQQYTHIQDNSSDTTSCTKNDKINSLNDVINEENIILNSKSYIPTPVTLLSGFLGSGKTTLLQHILKNKDNIKAAVLVNDMAEINVDSNLIKDTKLLKNGEEMVELHNGCICCTLKDELILEMKKLSKKQEFDVIIIESTGVSNPLEVAQTFYYEEEEVGEEGKILNDFARIDNLVTVIDSTSFFDYFKDTSQVNQKFSYEGGEYDDRNLCQLLMEQIEFANVLLINKVDLVDEECANHIKAIVTSMNPNARIFLTTKSEIELKQLINTNYFNEKEAFAHPDFWDLEKRNNHIPETQQFCIKSFLYKRDIPFHPMKLDKWLGKYFMYTYDLYSDPNQIQDEDEEWEEVEDDKIEKEETEEEKSKRIKEEEIEKKEKDRQRKAYEKLHKITHKLRNNTYGNWFRSKGILWLANPDKYNGYASWNHAGNYMNIGYANSWYDLPIVNSEEKEFTFEKALLNAKTEIIIIGQDLNQEKIIEDLDSCLISEDQFLILKKTVKSGKYKKKIFEDPFTDWPVWLKSKDPITAQSKYYEKLNKNNNSEFDEIENKVNENTDECGINNMKDENKNESQPSKENLELKEDTI